MSGIAEAVFQDWSEKELSELKRLAHRGNFETDRIPKLLLSCVACVQQNMRKNGQKIDPAGNDPCNEDFTEVAPQISPDPPARELDFRQVEKFGWDQTDAFVRIYISEGLEGVGKLDKDMVTCEFGAQSFDFKCRGLKETWRLHVPKTEGELLPEACGIKVKSDSVQLRLRKADQRTWSQLSAKTNKVPTFKGKNANPMDSMREVMRGMYESGDAEVKRTIAQAFEETQRQAELPTGGLKLSLDEYLKQQQQGRPDSVGDFM